MKLKVIFVSNTSWYLYNFYNELISFFISEGIEVIILSPDEEYFEKLSSLGATCSTIPLSRRGINPIEDFILVKNLFCIYKKINPELVFNFTIKPNIWSGFVCKKLKIPYVNTISGLGSSFIGGGLLKKITVFLYRLGGSHALHNLVMNNDDYKKMSCIFSDLPTKVKKIPGTGVDLDSFSHNPLPNKRRNSFLYIGRILTDKGINELLNVFSGLEGEDISLNIIGDFDDGNPTSIDKSLFLERVNSIYNINYLGYKSDIKKYIKDASFVILPSYREGLPRVLMESLSMSTPIVASNVPGCVDLITNQTGFLFEPKCESSLLLAIRQASKLSSHEYTKLCLSSRKFAEDNLDSNRVIKYYFSYCR